MTIFMIKNLNFSNHIYKYPLSKDKYNYYHMLIKHLKLLFNVLLLYQFFIQVIFLKFFC